MNLTMRSLAQPAYDARSTFILCAKSIRDTSLSSRLLSVVDEIEAAETRYRRLGANASLFTIAEAATVADRVGVQEMKSLYKDTFSRKGSKARHIYDAIKNAPQNGICPICGQRVISTLDHYLAKSKHPALTVTPLNLVPCCADCNKAKLDMQPANASAQTLHPYFDDVDDEVWLFATVKEISPPAIVFSVIPPASWDDVKQVRVLTHFRVFGLGALYSSHAAVELQNIHYSLTQYASRGGADSVRAHLAEQAESRQAIMKNSWQFAMYEALRKSEWFCQSGHRTIMALGAAA
jgi:hypothetical protein